MSDSGATTNVETSTQRLTCWPNMKFDNSLRKGSRCISDCNWNPKKFFDSTVGSNDQPPSLYEISPRPSCSFRLLEVVTFSFKSRREVEEALDEQSGPGQTFEIRQAQL